MLYPFSFPPPSAIFPTMLENEVTGIAELLKNDRIATTGWARRAFFAYSRPSSRRGLAETDSLCLYNSQKGYWLVIIFSDRPLSSIHSIVFIDTRLKRSVEFSMKETSTRGRCMLSQSIMEDSFSTWQDKDALATMTEIKRDSSRYFVFNAPSLVLPDGRKGLLADFSLFDDPAEESIACASGSGNDEKAFSLSQRLFPLKAASGFIRRGTEKDDLALDGALALFSWTRCRYMHDLPSWSVIALSDSLGLSFSGSKERMMSCLKKDGRIIRLAEVDMGAQDSLEKPWRISESDGRLDLDFIPLLSHSLSANPHASLIAGTVEGHVHMDDGTDMPVDAMPALCLVSRP